MQPNKFLMPASQTTQFDTDDQFDWDTITETTNENGVLTTRDTLFDDGSTFEEVLNGTTRDAVFSVAVDEQNANDWARIFTNFEVPFYDNVRTTPDGPITTNYDDQFDLPPEYLDLFGFIEVA